jgi:hypothetical protein
MGWGGVGESLRLLRVCQVYPLNYIKLKQNYILFFNGSSYKNWKGGGGGQLNAHTLNRYDKLFIELLQFCKLDHTVKLIDIINKVRRKKSIFPPVYRSGTQDILRLK